jgi:hypothetical protein
MECSRVGCFLKKGMEDIKAKHSVKTATCTLQIP